MPVTEYDKAIAGGVVSAVVALLARYGFHPKAATVTAAGVLVTAVVSYVVGHLAVYFKNNKVVQDVEKVVKDVTPPPPPVAPAV